MVYATSRWNFFVLQNSLLPNFFLGFLMLAAHLQPSNVDIWCRLADIEIQDNQIIAAISCYSRAIKAKPKETDLHLKRINLILEKCRSTKLLCSLLN